MERGVEGEANNATRLRHEVLHRQRGAVWLYDRKKDRMIERQDDRKIEKRWKGRKIHECPHAGVRTHA